VPGGAPRGRCVVAALARRSGGLDKPLENSVVSGIYGELRRLAGMPPGVFALALLAPLSALSASVSVHA